MRIRMGRGYWASRIGLVLLGTAVFLLLVGIGVATYYWISYGRMIDLRLSGHIQQTTARIYAAPMRISTGEALPSRIWRITCNARATANWTFPGRRDATSCTAMKLKFARPANRILAAKNRLVVDFSGNEIQKIRSMDNGAALDSVEVEPELADQPV